MVTLLIMAAAFNTGTNLLYMIVSTLLSLCIVSIFYGRFNLSGISAARRLPPEVHAGRPTEYELEVTNRRNVGCSYGVALQELSPELGSQNLSAYFLAVTPGEMSTRAVPVTFPRRGLFHLNHMVLMSCFPFGFVEFRADKRVSSEVLVYPRLLPMDSVLELQGPDLGAREINAKGHGVSLFSIRDYQSGDSARSIHWKLSSKGTGIKVREHEREEIKTIQLVLDFNCPAEPSLAEIEQFEKSVSVAASLAKFFLDRGFETALWTVAGSVPKSLGEGHLKRIMRALALIDIEKFKAAPAFPAAAPDVIQVWISSRPEVAAGAANGGNREKSIGDGGLTIDPTTVPDQPAPLVSSL